VDEAHYFRSRDVQHCKVLMNLIGAMKRVILLTGTNLLKKPHEIYCLLRMIRSDVMPGFYEFGYRYCDPRQSFDGIDFSNAGNMNELKKILEIRF
jgi:SWI/SNF-related matrix-associated actin-dependent regulator 1 of chromatin subfamily A